MWPPSARSQRSAVLTARPLRPDEAELDEPPRRAGQAKPPQVEEVVDRLAHRRLASTGEALTELEADFGLPELRDAHDQLEEDLEAPRPEARQVRRDGGPADQEESAHRIGDALQRAPETEARDAARNVREQRAQGAEVVSAPAVDEATRDDHVDIAVLRAAEQLRDHLGRVLQVGVHDAEPRPACRLEPGETAVARPPARSPAGRWMTLTGASKRLPASRISSAVLSSLSSTKMSSMSNARAIGDSRSRSGAMLSASSFVGTTTETNGVETTDAVTPRTGGLRPMPPLPLSRPRIEYCLGQRSVAHPSPSNPVTRWTHLGKLLDPGNKPIGGPGPGRSGYLSTPQTPPIARRCT